MIFEEIRGIFMYEANILLVDDETAILQLLTTILEKEGFLILQLQHPLKWLYLLLNKTITI